MTALGTRSLNVSVGGTDYTPQVFNCEIVGGPADDKSVTFAEAHQGGARKYTLKFTLTQDLATGSLWRKFWSSAGTTAAVVVKPYGNAAPSVDQPWYQGNVIIAEPDGTLIGGDADSSASARWTVDVEWEWTAKPTEITA